MLYWAKIWRKKKTKKTRGSSKTNYQGLTSNKIKKIDFSIRKEKEIDRSTNKQKDF